MNFKLVLKYVLEFFEKNNMLSEQEKREILEDTLSIPTAPFDFRL